MKPSPVKPNQMYGRLKVLSFDGLRRTGKQNYRYFKCECQCASKTVMSVPGHSLTGDNTASCGCLLREYRESLRSKPQCVFTPGERFGRLVVNKWVRTKRKHAYCEFQCDCGNVVVLPLNQVRFNGTKSCGCLRKEKARQMGKTYGSLHRLGAGESGLHRLFRSYKRNARNRKIDFDLDLEIFHVLTQKPCHYCTAPPAATTSRDGSDEHGHYVYNGVDRMDNAVGYTVKNSVTCCKDCNWAKRSRSYGDFITWIQRLAARLPILAPTSSSASGPSCHSPVRTRRSPDLNPKSS